MFHVTDVHLTNINQHITNKTVSMYLCWGIFCRRAYFVAGDCIRKRSAQGFTAHVVAHRHIIIVAGDDMCRNSCTVNVDIIVAGDSVWPATKYAATYVSVNPANKSVHLPWSNISLGLLLLLPSSQQMNVSPKSEWQTRLANQDPQTRHTLPPYFQCSNNSEPFAFCYRWTKYVTW